MREILWRGGELKKKMRDKSPRNVRGPGRMKETEKLHKIVAVSAHEARREESLDRTRDIHFSSENNAFRYSAPIFHKARVARDGYPATVA